MGFYVKIRKPKTISVPFTSFIFNGIIKDIYLKYLEKSEVWKNIPTSRYHDNSILGLLSSYNFPFTGKGLVNI